MQIAAEAEADLKRRTAAGQKAVVAAAAQPAQCAMPDAEYKRLFISLIDPTAMVRTEKCLEIAERICAYSAAAGWEQGVRTAGLLKGVYEDMSEMLDKQVADGVLGHAIGALRDTLDYLRRFGRSYRDGTPVEHREYAFITDEEELAALREERDLDPILALEKVRSKVADLRNEAAEMERRRAADEAQDQARLPAWIEMQVRSRTCRESLTRSELRVREYFKKRGMDHVFPPKAKSIVGMLADCAVPGVSSLDMVRETRRRGL